MTRIKNPEAWGIDVEAQREKKRSSRRAPPKADVGRVPGVEQSGEPPEKVQSVQFTVPGRPHGKKRPKLTTTEDGKPHSYEDPATRRYEQKVGHCARKVRPEGWPLGAEYRLTVHAVYPDRRVADISNVAKAIEDGLDEVLYEDDRQVVELEASREVSGECEEGLVLVRVEVISE